MDRSDITELHFISACSNVASILLRGILCHRAARKISHSSVADDKVQAIRARLKVPRGLGLHDYANLYFNARNAMMYTLVMNNPVPLCVLVIDSAVLGLPDVVVYDGNAASDKWSKPSSVRQGLASLSKEMVFRRDWRHQIPAEYYRRKSVVQSEVLVPSKVDPAYILRAYVPTQAVEGELNSANPGLRTTVNPDVFFNHTRFTS